MIKKIKAIVKLTLTAGKANPAPPIGPALGHFGINLVNFCKDYNEKTKDKIGLIIPVKITIYEDLSYSYILKTSPVSFLLLNILNLKKGSSKSSKENIGSISYSQLKEIALIKLSELNTNNLENAIKSIRGTAINMGIKII